MQHDRLLIPTSVNNVNPDSALPQFMSLDVQTSKETGLELTAGRLQPKIEGPFIVPAEKLARYGSEKDYPNTPEIPAYGNGDCPLLAQNLIPNDKLGEVKNFVQGNVLYKGSEADRITPPNPRPRYAEIEHETVIFTPNARGRYDNLPSGNHVAIFLSYDIYGGERGIFVIDQYLGRRTNGKQTSGIRFIKARTGAVAMRSNDARAFAVVLAIRPPRM